MEAGWVKKYMRSLSSRIHSATGRSSARMLDRSLRLSSGPPSRIATRAPSTLRSATSRTAEQSAATSARRRRGRRRRSDGLPSRSPDRRSGPRRLGMSHARAAGIVSGIGRESPAHRGMRGDESSSRHETGDRVITGYGSYSRRGAADLLSDLPRTGYGRANPTSRPSCSRPGERSRRGSKSRPVTAAVLWRSGPTGRVRTARARRSAARAALLGWLRRLWPSSRPPSRRPRRGLGS